MDPNPGAPNGQKSVLFTYIRPQSKCLQILGARGKGSPKGYLKKRCFIPGSSVDQVSGVFETRLETMCPQARDPNV